MTIREIKKFEYKGCQVTIRQLGEVFEYLIVYKGRLYNSNSLIKPNIWKRWKKENYSKADMENIEMMMVKKAVEAAETLSTIQDKKSKSKMKHTYEARKKTKLLQGIE